MKEHTNKNEIITLQELIMNTELPEELEALKEQFADPVPFCPKYVFAAYHVWEEIDKGIEKEVTGELYPRKEFWEAVEGLSKIAIPAPEQIGTEKPEEYFVEIQHTIGRATGPLVSFIYNYSFWEKENLTLPEILGSQVIMKTVEDYGVVPFLTNVMNRLNSQKEESEELEDNLKPELEEDEEEESEKQFAEEYRKEMCRIAREVAENAREMRKIGKMM